MSDLSPAAQAISNAYENNLSGYIETGLIAAIRELADQVVPIEAHPEVYEDCCQYSDVKTCAGIRASILSIAAELEGQQ